MERTNALIIKEKISKGDKFIPADWLNKLYSAIEDIDDKAYIIYHAETGLRVSDVVNTEIVHIDWKQCRTYTYDHKKDQWRWVYWPEWVKAILLQWMKFREAAQIKDQRLFTISAKTANRILRYWAKRIEFPYANQIGSHWLRHTFIRLSRKSGRDIKAVQQNTGDKIETLLEWYSDLNAEDMREQIEKKIH